MTRVLVLLLPLFVLPACSGGASSQLDSETIKEVAGEVLTFQSGTVNELRRRRGKGPFTHYDLPPDELLTVVYRAAKKARGVDGQPIRGVWKRKISMEVVAKERTAEFVESEKYDDPWRTAMLAMVHPVPGKPNESRLEIHATSKGPFHKGRIAWTHTMPCWIREVLAEPEPLPGGIKRIR